MRTTSRRRAAGFTQLEMMIVVAIVGMLASISLPAYRDYSRRASLSEVVLATASCKQAVTENYTLLTDAPDAGRWGCESSTSSRKHVGAIQTSSDGVIRIAIRNLDGLVNGQYVYMVPAKSDGSAMVTPNDLGRSPNRWICGSDWLPVRNATPANCRADTTTYASQDFQ